MSSTRKRERRIVDGQINFASNDYLGLANNPCVKDAAIQAIRDYGLGAQGSAYICGYTDAHQMLEEQFAIFYGYEKALLFSSGFTANLTVTKVLMQPSSIIFHDAHNHASLIDGVRESGAISKRYRHCQVAHLTERLAKVPLGTDKWIISDGVFSMSGRQADVDGLINLAKAHQAKIFIDEAHALGVVGIAGHGHRALASSLDLITIPLGKAIGVSGAIVTGATPLMNRLEQLARPLIYSTAPPPVIAVAASQAFQLLQSGQHWQQLQANIQYFKSATKLESDSAIFYIKHPHPEHLQDCFLRKGIWLRAIRPPTVPSNTQGIRIVIRSNHSRAELDVLIEAIKYYV